MIKLLPWVGLDAPTVRPWVRARQEMAKVSPVMQPGWSWLPGRALQGPASGMGMFSTASVTVLL